MLLLLVGLAIFFTVHTIPWTPALRDKMIAKMGENGYKGFFAIVSAIGLTLAILTA